MRTIQVTDDHVAAFRAYLTKDMTTLAALRDRIDETRDWNGYAAMISAGFFHMAERRFGGEASRRDIILFAAGAHARFLTIGEEFDEVVAESMLRDVVDPHRVEDIDDRLVTRTEAQVLFLLVLDAELTTGELDELIELCHHDADDMIRPADD